MSKKPSKEPPRLGALLRIASQAMSEQFVQWLAASKYSDLQPAHSAAIQPLWELADGARVTDLARASRITKQSMSALVSHLESSGYIERVPHPEDARAAHVRLTARGREYGVAVRAFSRKVEADWAARIGAERVAALVTTLDLLRQSMD